MAARSKGDKALEPRLVDLDVAGCCGDDLAAVDQEGLCGVRPDRNLARNGDSRSVQHAVIDFDAARVFRIEAVPAAEVEETGLKAALLLGERPAARRQLQIVQAHLVNRSRP